MASILEWYADADLVPRYVILLYVQPSTFAAPADLANPGTPLAPFSLSSYVSSSGLGPLVAANYFQVENGVATVTVYSRLYPLPCLANNW